jgi:hypothetical protein
VGRKTVFACDSPDVVNHEQGHAVLDALKPQLWDAASIEADAFHESFGDISAILCALQLQTLRLGVIEETQGAIYRSSRLGRLAEQLGWAVRQSNPSAVDPDCLRNAVNSFFYRDPHTLPSTGPASTLSSEPHSFCRVFTAAFLEGLAGMFKLRPTRDEDNLLQVSQDIGLILVNSLRAAAVVPTYFSQVAAQMMQVANTQFPKINYSQALKSAFVRHGILSPAVSIVVAPAAAAMDGAADLFAADQNTELPQLRLSVAEYDLGVDTILVHAAAGPTRFDVAGAALSIGSVVPPAQEEAAKSYLENLLRRGRLKVLVSDHKGKSPLGITRANEPETHETHTHELRQEGGEWVLRRVRIACTAGS